jgi:hypothetical protein
MIKLPLSRVLLTPKGAYLQQETFSNLSRNIKAKKDDTGNPIKKLLRRTIQRNLDALIGHLDQ